MNRRALSPRERSIFFLGLGILSAFLIFQGVWGPIHGRRIAIRQKWISSQRELKKNLSLIQEYPQIERRYTEYSAFFLQKEENEVEMTGLLSSLETVALKLNVRLWEVKPQRVKHNDFYNDFSIQLMLEEELLTIVHFLYILQNPPYFFDVAEMRLEKNSPQKPSLKCSVVLGRTLIQNFPSSY